jgi:hypothetical protein
MVNISYCVDNEIAQAGMEKEYETVSFSFGFLHVLYMQCLL